MAKQDTEKMQTPVPEKKVTGTPVEAPKPSSETITISKGQLQAFVQDAVAKAMGSKVEKPSRVKEHTAVVRYLDGQPVIKIAGLKERKVDGKNIGYINVTLLDGIVKEVEYLPFLNETERMHVKILSQKAEQHITSGNMGNTVYAENPNPYEIKNFTSREIELEVVSYTYEANVEVTTEGEYLGNKFTIDTAFLNI